MKNSFRTANLPSSTLMKHLNTKITVFLLAFFFSAAHAQTITTYAGTGTSGYSGDGGQATAAKLKYPRNVCFDTANSLFLSDRLNNVIRKISKTGIITTIAGNGTAGYTADGAQATAASFKIIGGIAVDKKGNIYFSEGDSSRVRKVNTMGIISTIAGNGTNSYAGDGGQATAASFGNSLGVALDAVGNIYISDNSHTVIRKIDHVTGIISTFAGNGTSGYSGDGGPATAAQIYGPNNIATDKYGYIYFAEEFNHTIRRVRTAAGVENLQPAAPEMVVAPNPSNNGQFTLKITSDNNEAVHIVATNITGTKIAEQSSYTNKEITLQLNTAPAGMYVITATTKQGTTTQQVIIGKY